MLSASIIECKVF